MHVRNVKNSNNKPMFLLMDNDNKVVLPVYKYILHLARCGSSKCTLKNYTHRLKLYYEWLDKESLTYLDVVHGKDKNHKAPLEYLADFVTWLKYPEYNPKIVSIDRTPMEPVRSNNTINNIMATIYSFYDYLVLIGESNELDVYKTIRSYGKTNSILSEMFIYHEKNKKQSLLLQKPEKKSVKYITREEYLLIYKNCTCRRDRIICGLMFEGGLRVSEVVGLNLEDLKHLNENRIDITYRNDPMNPDAAVKYRSEGAVYLPDYLVNEIILHINEFVDVDTNYLIFNLYGDTKYQPMKTDTIRDMIERVSKKVGLSNIHPHMFRHGCAVEMYSLIATQKNNPNSPMYGMQLTDIKDKLRHSNIGSTEIYVDCTSEARSKAAKDFYKQISEDFTEEDFELLADSIMVKKED